MTSSITKQFIIDYLAELSNSERVDILSKVSDKINSCNVITESKIEEHNESKIEEPEPESKIEEPESKAEPEEQQQQQQQQPDVYCCCCYEETDYITRCNHTLCTNCFSNIESMANGFIPCPICRLSIEDGVSNNGFIREITDYETMMIEAKQRYKIILDATFKFLKLNYREYSISILPDGFLIRNSINQNMIYDIQEGFEGPLRFTKYLDFIRKIYRKHVKSCETDYTWVSDDDNNTWNIKYTKINIKYINMDNGNQMDILQCLPVNPALSTDDYYDKKAFLDNSCLDLINKILHDDQIASRNEMY